MPKMVKALKSFPYSPNGIDVQTIEKDQVFACPDDIVSGLVESEMVEEVPEGAEPTPREELAPLEVVGASPSPDIEPIEHGGETLDRVLGKEGQQPGGISRDVATEEAAIGAGAKALKSYENKALGKEDEQVKEGEPNPTPPAESAPEPRSEPEGPPKGRKGR